MYEANNKYRKPFEELEKVASKFWPSELAQQEAELSVIPLLLKTQHQFISILSISTQTLDDLFTIIESSDLPVNLFVKHLLILADFSGEKLQRISTQFIHLFPEGKMSYYWKGQHQIYIFKTFDVHSGRQRPQFNNSSLKIRSVDIVKDKKKEPFLNKLSNVQKDAIALLLFGNTYTSENDKDIASILAKCEIGSYLGKPEDISIFMTQRYIQVSRVTGGAEANTLGQITQKFVAKYIKDELDLNNLEIRPGGRLPNVTHTDEATGRLTSFDLVITNKLKYVAIEVSFQVTTNSVIERKAGQARSRYEQIEAAGHKIAYVIDGAGNFHRKAAVETICAYSHCTVAFSPSELEILCQFLRRYFSE